MAQIEESLKEEAGKFSELFHGGFGRAMMIGVGLAPCDVVFNYSAA